MQRLLTTLLLTVVLASCLNLRADAGGVRGMSDHAAEDTQIIGEPEADGTLIMGTAEADAQQMRACLLMMNPDATEEMLGLPAIYLEEGAAEGVRGDIAFAQACLETGWFRFPPPTAVTYEQYNFCGMGVTSTGMTGNSFETPREGIRAQIQHLKAYATTDDLVNECVDPRFEKVHRGCAPYVEWLGIQENPQGYGWAAGADYGPHILNILDEILRADAAPAEQEEAGGEGTDQGAETDGSTMRSLVQWFLEVFF